MTTAKFTTSEFKGTIYIDRQTSLVTVRPLHSRQEYTLPLSTVADIIVAKVIKSNLDDQGIRVPQARKGRQR